MENQTVEYILLNLLEGKDPRTGAAIKDGSAILEDNVKEALNSALEAIKSHHVLRMNLPANTGKPWSNKDDKKLSESYEKGINIELLAKEFKRTRGAIHARLIKLGKLEGSENIFL